MKKLRTGLSVPRQSSPAKRSNDKQAGLQKLLSRLGNLQDCMGECSRIFLRRQRTCRLGPKGILRSLQNVLLDHRRERIPERQRHPGQLMAGGTQRHSSVRQNTTCERGHQSGDNIERVLFYPELSDGNGASLLSFGERRVDEARQTGPASQVQGPFRPEHWNRAANGTFWLGGPTQQRAQAPR